MLHLPSYSDDVNIRLFTQTFIYLCATVIRNTNCMCNILLFEYFNYFSRRNHKMSPTKCYTICSTICQIVPFTVLYCITICQIVPFTVLYCITICQIVPFTVLYCITICQIVPFTVLYCITICQIVPLCHYLLYCLPSTKASTTDGSASVDVSPSSDTSPSAMFRNIRRIILPERVFGKAGVN